MFGSFDGDLLVTAVERGRSCYRLAMLTIHPHAAAEMHVVSAVAQANHLLEADGSAEAIMRTLTSIIAAATPSLRTGRFVLE